MSSEIKNTWASMHTVADMLISADSISRIEFYISKRENSPPEIACRCFGMPGASKADLDVLAGKLNEAIQPVLSAHASGLQSKAANQLRRFL